MAVAHTCAPLPGEAWGLPQGGVPACPPSPSAPHRPPLPEGSGEGDGSVPTATCLPESHIKAVTPRGLFFVWLLSLLFVVVPFGHAPRVARAHFSSHVQCPALRPLRLSGPAAAHFSVPRPAGARGAQCVPGEDITRCGGLPSPGLWGRCRGGDFCRVTGRCWRRAGR